MNKSNDRKTIIIFIVIGVVLFSIFGFKFYNDFLSDNNSNKQISSIKSYGYSLNANDTSIYESKYKELESVLNINKRKARARARKKQQKIHELAMKQEALDADRKKRKWTYSKYYDSKEINDALKSKKNRK